MSIWASVEKKVESEGSTQDNLDVNLFCLGVKTNSHPITGKEIGDISALVRAVASGDIKLSSSPDYPGEADDSDLDKDLPNQ